MILHYEEKVLIGEDGIGKVTETPVTVRDNGSINRLNPRGVIHVDKEVDDSVEEPYTVLVNLIGETREFGVNKKQFGYLWGKWVRIEYNVEHEEIMEG